MLELKDICVKSGNFTLKGVNLEIFEGETHVLLGPSGAGKTTLLETIAGFRKPSLGKILFNGKDISSLEVHKRDIGYLPQNSLLFPHLNVYENIIYSLRSKKIDIEKEKKYLDILYRQTKIEHLLKRDVKNLSGGEKQRVALVRALASKPKILLLDEPFSALNETLRKDLWILLKNLQKRFKFTSLMVTHFLQEAFVLGDRISVVIEGKILQSSKREEIWQRPQKKEVAEYFGIKNIFDISVYKKGSKSVVKNEILGEFEIENLKENFLFCAIRSEYIKILQSREDLKKGYIVLEGEVKDSVDLGRERLLFFVPKNFDKVIEVKTFDFTSLKDIKIALPIDKIFFLN